MAPNGSAPPQGRLLDIPVLTDWRRTDSVGVLHSILAEHERGMFASSALLVDEMLTDDRISGVLETRIGGLLAAPLTFKPADDRRKSMKLAQILGGADESEDDGEWLRMVDRETAATLLKWRIMLGFAVGKSDWEPSTDAWLPRVTVWHPRHVWWNWGLRAFQLATSGPDPTNPSKDNGDGTWTITLPRVDRGDTHGGKWFVWGRPYSWMRGAIRALGMKFLDRTWNERDWARYCEKHGMAIVEGQVPSGTDVDEKAQFLSDLQNIGNEPTIICPQMPAGEPGYGVELKEAQSRSWEAYKARKEALDTDIAILLLGQNLTTEVKSGSRSAAEVHEGIRIDKKRADAELFQAVREQVLVPWAYYNWTYPDMAKANALAPYPSPQIEPPEDEESEATALGLLGEACKKLSDAYSAVDVRAILESHGVPIDEERAAAADERLANPPAPPVPPVGGNGQDGPTSQPAANGEAQAPGGEKAATSAALTAIAMLKASKTTGPAALKRVARYHDALVARARANAAAALAPDLEAIREDIASGKDFPDIKRRIIRRFKAMKSPNEMAKIIERVNLLGNMTGREDVLRGL